jgi:ABC-type enterochelin transport system substrate-binding protein
MLTETATALASTGGAEGITKTISAINSVDTGKLEALKELSVWMSLLGATTTIKFEENLHVDGSIDLKGKDGSSMSIDFDKLNASQKAELAQLVFNTTRSERNGGGGSKT